MFEKQSCEDMAKNIDTFLLLLFNITVRNTNELKAKGMQNLYL